MKNNPVGIPGLSEFAGLAPLGSGGCGDVFAGTRITNGERVVVKVLRDPHIAEMRRLFEREVRILSLGVTGVVPILWSDLQTARPYYVMPLLTGSLTQFAGLLSSGQVENIGVVVAGALAQLHGRWISHGDIKPDNLLLGQNGQTLVADPLGNGCGCTVMFAAHRGGTPGYCAPEVFGGGEISQDGDIFSLGASLHHLISGRRPEQGCSFQLAPKHAASRRLREAIAIATHADPRSRPSANDLKRILRGEGWESIRSQRNWNIALGVSAAFVVAVALSDGN
ncbi:MAG: hypothetical protein JWO05_3862 [Gemmatimonadetes bacterium]|nr:hypothetical protein [Gemmatimonadota bacterium]